MIELTDLRDFSICNWYEKFDDVTIQTILIDIPEAIIEAFRIDANVEELFREDCHKGFIEEVSNALNTLNRTAFVKNNWHAPVDAKMFSLGNSLQVTSIDDIIMYFTNSTIIQEDFINAKGMTFHLALKPFKPNIHPAAEFRCIVVNNVLRGITPRDWPTYYAHFHEEGPQIIENLNTFFNEKIKMRFFRKNYVFDTVLQYPNSPYIIDFSPLNSKTILYAFNWNEIHPLMTKTSTDVAPVFRFLENDIGIMTKLDALNRFAKSQGQNG